jgi:hypothetical protein
MGASGGWLVMFAGNRAALALFGFAMIGAKDCTIILPWDPGTPDEAPHLRRSV